ncbi:pectinesterase inhibitor [Prosopis cineraria]|uniref:pectinesterase inhibitor n=1 Tax=Prosopis cineraria TaxID=364024 RepID=UPI00240F8932|nr:pectinesterase inhibitor [Prosopis cineraria]
MASLPFIIFSLLFLFSLVTPSTAKLTEDEIKVICLQTRDPPFCFRTLESDPRVDMSNIQTLARTMINKAHNYARKTYNEIDSIIEITGDRSVREKYQLCAEMYKEAMAEIGGAKQNLASGYYQKVRLEAVGAKLRARTCGETLEKTSKTITPIRDNNRDFRNLCNIVWSISNRLIMGD